MEKSTVYPLGFCGTHEQKQKNFKVKRKKEIRYNFFEILKLQYGAMGYPLDGGSNDFFLKAVPSIWGGV